MIARSSVDTLHAERVRLLATVEKAVGDGPATLTVEQRRIWTTYRLAVIEAQIAEDEYLNSLLPEPMTDEERTKIVEDLYKWEADTNGRDYADLMDFAHESDYSLFHEHQEYLEDAAEMADMASNPSV